MAHHPNEYVGRALLLESLGEALEGLSTGRGSIVLLTGDAGLGKTRTTEELAAMARARGMGVLASHCDRVPGTTPLWPWLEPLRELVHPSGRGEATLVVGPSTPIGTLLEEEGGGSSAGAQPAERSRLVHDIVALLRAAAREKPRVLIFDDLHAADAESAELLAFVAAELTDASVLVVGTYCDSELTAEHPLAAALGRLASRGRVHVLDALTADEVALLASSESARPLPSGAVEVIAERSEGHPQFAKQLVASLTADRADAPMRVEQIRTRTPEGVRHVIRRRLSPLDSALSDTLATAAVMGRDFEADVVARARGEETDALVRRLNAALARRLLRSTERAGHFSFAHGLVRDVLYEGLDASDRAERHGAVARAIAALREADLESWLGELAHHHLQSGEDPGAAVEWATRASESALSSRAHDDAADIAARAVSELDANPNLSGASTRRARLFRLLGEAAWRAGRTTQARAHYADAIEVAREIGDAAGLATAAIGYAGRTDATLGPENEAAALLSEAVDRLGPEPTRLRAEALARLATSLYFSPAPERAEQAGREGVACAEALGGADALAYALTALHYVSYRPGRLAARRAISERTLAVAEGERVDRAIRALAHFQAILDGLEAGDFDKSDGHLEVYGELTARLEQPYYRWQHVALRATRALARGRLEEAEALAGEALTLGQATESPSALAIYSAQLYTLRREQDRLPELVPLLEDLAAQHPSVVGYRFALAEANLASGSRDEVEAFLRAESAASFANLPDDWNWPAVMSIATRLCSELEMATSAETLYEQLRPAAGTCIVLGIGNVWDGAVDGYLGALASTSGHFERAADHLHRAAALHARIGARVHLAHSWRDLGRLHLRWHRRGVSPEAATWLTRAAELYGELGLDAREARCLAERPPSSGGVSHSGAHAERPAAPSAARKTPPAERLAEEWLARGADHDRAGDRDAAVAAFQRAGVVARASELPLHFARAVLGERGDMRAGTAQQTQDTARLAALEQALAGVPSGELELRTRLTSALATELYWSNNLERTQALADEALALARTASDPRILIEAVLSALIATWFPENVQQRLDLCDEAIQLARETGDRRAQLIGHHYRAMTRLESADGLGADVDLALADRLANEGGHRLLAHLLGNVRVVRLLSLGRYGEAEALAREQLAEGERLGAQHAPVLYATHRLNLALHRSPPQEVLAPLRGLVSVNPLPVLRAGLAYNLCLAGEHEEGRREMESMLAAGLDLFPRDFFYLATLAYLAETAAFLGDRALAHELCRRLSPHAGQWILIGFGANVLGSVDRTLGLLLQLLGREDDAAEHLNAAIATERRMKATPFLALALDGMAGLCASRPDRKERRRAAALRTEASRLRDQTGMRLRALPVGEHSADEAPRPDDREAARLTHKPDGKRWELEYAGRTAELVDARGLAYLAELLARPGHEFHVLDLLAHVAPEGTPRERNGGMEVLDARSRGELRERMHSLRDELDEAQAFADLGRAERLREEFQAIEDQLSAALGLGGRQRRLGDNVERARKAVYNRLRSTIARIEGELPTLGHHLRHSIRTGRTCSYRPEHPLHWEIRVEASGRGPSTSSSKD